MSFKVTCNLAQLPLAISRTYDVFAVPLLDSDDLGAIGAPAGEAQADLERCRYGQPRASACGRHLTLKDVWKPVCRS